MNKEVDEILIQWGKWTKSGRPHQRLTSTYDERGIPSTSPDDNPKYEFMSQAYSKMPPYYSKDIIKYRYLKNGWVEKAIMKNLGIQTRDQYKILRDNCIDYFAKELEEWEIDN